MPEPPTAAVAELEDRLIAGLLAEPAQTLAAVREVLRPEDLSRQSSRTVYEALCGLQDAGEAPGMSAVWAEIVARRAEGLFPGGFAQFAVSADLLDAPLPQETVGIARRLAPLARERRATQAAKAFARNPNVERRAALSRALEQLEEDLGGGRALPLVPVEDFLTAELGGSLWIVEGLVPGGGVTFLFGPAGLGKSLLAWELATAVARGEPFLGRFGVCGGPVFYLNAEMPPPAFQERLRRVNRLRPFDDAPLHVYNASLNLTDEADLAALRAACESIRPALVIADPLIRCLPGVDENNASEVSQALAPLADLGREMSHGTLLVHHSTKGALRGGLDALAGSRDFGARADCVFSLRPAREGEGLLRFACEKSRWGAPPEAVYLRVETDPATGAPVLTTCETASVRDEVLGLLAGGPLRLKDLVEEMEGTFSRDQIKRAVRGLLGEGRLAQTRRGEYSLPDEASRLPREQAA
jgi:hypothetical protein